MNDQLLMPQSRAAKRALLTDASNIISWQCIMHIPPQ